MKNFKYLSKKSAILFTAILLLVSCADLSVENLNDPDRERALASPSDLVSLLGGSTANVFFEITSDFAVHQDGLSDQTTSTNNFRNFWDFTEEPRRRIDNRTSYATPQILTAQFGAFNSGTFTANEIIKIIELEGRSIILDGDIDVTQKMLAAAYFLRGVSRGYISLTYDQGYIADADADVLALELFPYTEVADAAIADLDRAIEVADGIGGTFVWDFFPNNDSWNLAQFKTIAHSMAARILAGVPRTMAEAENHDWDRVLSYADKAIGGPDAADPAMFDFTATSVGPFVFYNNLQDWSGLVLSDGAGYLPTDLKVLHLLDPGYPVSYPAAPEILDPAESDDPRIEYFNYTEAFGFLNPARNRSIFSNYWNLRMFCNNNCGQSGFPIVYYLEAETDYIRAEAYLRNGDKLTAANILNESPFGNGITQLSIDLPAKQLGLTDYNGKSGGNSINATASDTEFQLALLREYSVELTFMGGSGSQWHFMRRWDMLQAGTPLHLPVPGSELEITRREIYTFGGAGNGGETGTSAGNNSWKELRSKVQAKAVEGSEGEIYKPMMLTLENLNALSRGSNFKPENN